MKSTNFKLNSSPKQRNNKKSVAFLLVIMALVIGIGSVVLVSRQNHQKALQAEQKARDEAQTNSAKKTVEESEVNSSSSDSANSKTTQQVTPSLNTSIKIVEVEQNNGAVTATAVIEGADKTGVCVFTYTTTDDKPVVQQVDSISGKCVSSIPEVQFSKVGSWNLNTIFYLDNSKAEVNKSVTIN